ncbi:CbiX/SirB N-terminal domain-containing protein [Oscillatoria amoena NRMC-F 0135]|nr:CbiX/SirB N-terminal domain-containing protein [Oscillatoria amoena NRMC-F 0135]
MRSIITSLLISLCIIAQVACSSSSGETSSTTHNNQKKIGVLLVNHGSRSATWRQSLLTLEESVKDSLIGYGKIEGTKTAFMEYNEPSIATRLKEFDAEGYTDVIIVPIFLTVSSHSFDDIPTIIGKKEDPQSLETLKIEKIERYTPRANTHMAPLLDFSGMLKENILRRATQLSKDPAREGLVMIAYGDATYMKEWSALLQEVGDHVKQKSGISAYSYGWCGHVAHYNPDSTTVAINRVFAYKEKALVVPVLVAHDEMFQVKIIGDGIANTGMRKSDVAYIADSILPDQNIESWVVRIARDFADNLTTNSLAQVP